jgi:hypothetical protein
LGPAPMSWAINHPIFSGQVDWTSYPRDLYFYHKYI